MLDKMIGLLIDGKQYSLEWSARKSNGSDVIFHRKSVRTNGFNYIGKKLIGNCL